MIVREPLLKWAKANGISQTKAYEMAHAKKYIGIIVKIEGRYKVDVQAFEELLKREQKCA